MRTGALHGNRQKAVTGDAVKARRTRTLRREDVAILTEFGLEW